ncbi:MAG: hypothetical protein ABW277_06200 [Longimicrobiaceae bacterium]
MKRNWRMVRAGALAAGVAGVLGFGVSQALASPAAADAALVCSTSVCVNWCQKQYGPYANGQCAPSGFGCVCSP